MRRCALLVAAVVLLGGCSFGSQVRLSEKNVAISPHQRVWKVGEISVGTGMGGRLTLVNGCLGLQHGPYESVLLWPFGTVVVTEPELGIVSRDLDGNRNELRIGDEISFGVRVGGYRPSGIALPESCAGSPTIVVADDEGVEKL